MLSVMAYKSAYDVNIKPLAQESDWPKVNSNLLKKAM
jgi:hypothetical protein